MSEPFIGQVVLFAGNFAPRGWALCQGQLLSISQNTALFSILGTTYGGNGQTTFALPDLRGRVPVGQGPGPGLPATSLGQVGGEAAVTLLSAQMPVHTHAMNVTTNDADSKNPSGRFLAGTASPVYASATSGATLNANALSSVGGGQAHNNMQPYLGLNYIIALQGVFPSRN